jgi:hypothetical protein
MVGNWASRNQRIVVLHLELITINIREQQSWSGMKTVQDAVDRPGPNGLGNAVLRCQPTGRQRRCGRGWTWRWRFTGVAMDGLGGEVSAGVERTIEAVDAGDLADKHGSRLVNACHALGRTTVRVCCWEPPTDVERLTGQGFASPFFCSGETYVTGKGN